MVRKFLYAAALAASMVTGAAMPAAAQTFGGVTLSIGTPAYRHYDNRYGYRPYYRDRYADWRARERWERRMRWERERARRHYWREEARRDRYWRERDWRYHDDRYGGY